MVDNEAKGSGTSRDTTAGDQRGNPAEHQREIFKASVKVPPFWKENPELWFAQVESQFITSGITADATKYHTVVAAIDGNILLQVSDIILHPPNENMHCTLRQRLFREYGESEPRRLNKLLQEMDLGDKKPSQLLRQMRDLAGSCVNDDFLKTLWMQRLPQNMRAIVSVSSEGLEQLAILADKVAEVNEFQQVADCSARYLNKSSDSSIKEQLAELTRQVAELKRPSICTSNAPYARRNSRSRSRKYSRSNICWYHRKFNNKAKKCQQPCDFQKMGNDLARQ